MYFPPTIPFPPAPPWFSIHWKGCRWRRDYAINATAPFGNPWRFLGVHHGFWRCSRPCPAAIPHVSWGRPFELGAGVGVGVGSYGICILVCLVIVPMTCEGWIFVMLYFVLLAKDYKGLHFFLMFFMAGMTTHTLIAHGPTNYWRRATFFFC